MRAWRFETDCRGTGYSAQCILDALLFASGNRVVRVELRGDVVRDGVLLCAQESTVLWRYDATVVLSRFAWDYGVVGSSSMAHVSARLAARKACDVVGRMVIARRLADRILRARPCV